MKKIYKNLLYKNFNMFLVSLPTPINISIYWNFGSLLGMFLMIQIISGILLSMHYVANVDYAFLSVTHIMVDVNYGWLIRLTHMNGASFFFMCVYMHIGRGIYYGSYKLKMVWFIGVLILLMMMGTAFMGYVLPWGQMSFWGATVITNLLSAIPYIGQYMVEWLWGGFSVNNATLNRFYTLHFIMPFILLILVMLHLIYLHSYGSSNPLGINSNLYKIKFHSYFSIKDLVGFIISWGMFLYFNCELPYILGDVENFLSANPMITPIHIQPEWYFLFAYTILRCIPNKLSGVIALLFSILILYLYLFMNKNNFQGLVSYPLNQMLYWGFTNNFMFLTWLGAQPVEEPFIYLSQISGSLYFMFYFVNYWLMKFWDFILK